MKQSQQTTIVGYTNRNQQVNLGFDNPNGTDHNQKVYALRCARPLSNGDLCGMIYGVNGSDIFQAKCPKCQGGKENLSLTKHFE